MPKEPDFEPFDDFGIRRLTDAEFDKFFTKVTFEQFDDLFGDFNLPAGSYSDSADFEFATFGDLDFIEIGDFEFKDVGDFFLPPDDDEPPPPKS